MDLEKEDKLKEPSVAIDESFEPYFSDSFLPGQVKEQNNENQTRFFRRYCKATLSGTVTTPFLTTVPFDVYSTNDQLMKGVNSGEIRITRSGIYNICTQIDINSTVTTYGATANVNGVVKGYFYEVVTGGISRIICQAQTTTYLNAGDIVTAFAYANVPMKDNCYLEVNQLL